MAQPALPVNGHLPASSAIVASAPNHLPDILSHTTKPTTSTRTYRPNPPYRKNTVLTCLNGPVVRIRGAAPNPTCPDSPPSYPGVPAPPVRAASAGRPTLDPSGGRAPQARGPFLPPRSRRREPRRCRSGGTACSGEPPPASGEPPPASGEPPPASGDTPAASVVQRV